MVTTIEGVMPSADIRAELSGQKVLLAFSRGKDSLAAWLALREAGVDVIPYHLYLIPHLRFVDESLRSYEDFFDCHIFNLPHPSLFRWLNSLVFVPPERIRTIEAASMPSFTYDDVADMLREDHGLGPDPLGWVCDGVRAADSPVRRISFVTHGPHKTEIRRTSPIWDWQIADVRAILARHNCPLPIDYEWFGRSFDGMDYRFIEPLRRYAPDDYAKVIDWFPLAELEFFRAEHILA